MVVELVLVIVGMIVGLPIALFGFMRQDEQPGRLSVALLAAGLLIALGPTVFASVAHYRATSGHDRYDAW